MADAVARVVRDSPTDRWGDTLGMGADGTATKMVDDLAEREILALLRRPKPKLKLNLLSEEAGYVDLKGDAVLVADPIDGTTNAVRGIPFYCVSLAIGRTTLDDVEAGLVMNLSTGDKFEAVRGQGATRNGKPLQVRPPNEKDLVVSTPGAGAKGGLHRSFGACALEMCLVASGALDCYHYPKPALRIIDVAAATLIVREAGGVVVDRAGKDLELPLSLVPRFGLTAASSRDLATKIGGAPA
jgi:fructose-1,6-bisphosphatase/inositol monophosphatase family enzyme